MSDTSLVEVVNHHFTTSYARVLQIHLRDLTESEWKQMNLRMCFEYHMYAAARLRRDVEAWEPTATTQRASAS